MRNTDTMKSFTRSRGWPEASQNQTFWDSNSSYPAVRSSLRWEEDQRLAPGLHCLAYGASPDSQASQLGDQAQPRRQQDMQELGASVPNTLQLLVLPSSPCLFSSLMHLAARSDPKVRSSYVMDLEDRRLAGSAEQLGSGPVLVGWAMEWVHLLARLQP